MQNTVAWVSRDTCGLVHRGEGSIQCRETFARPQVRACVCECVCRQPAGTCGTSSTGTIRIHVDDQLPYPLEWMRSFAEDNRPVIPFLPIGLVMAHEKTICVTCLG